MTHLKMSVSGKIAAQRIIMGRIARRASFSCTPLRGGKFQITAEKDAALEGDIVRVGNVSGSAAKGLPKLPPVEVALNTTLVISLVEALLDRRRAFAFKVEDSRFVFSIWPKDVDLFDGKIAKIRIAGQ